MQKIWQILAVDSQNRRYYGNQFTSLNVTCVNINFLQQLGKASELTRLRNNKIVNSKRNQESLLSSSAVETISLVNATAKVHIITGAVPDQSKFERLRERRKKRTINR
jgi:hypothetical protein